MSRSTLTSPRITLSATDCPTLSLSSVLYRSVEFLMRFPSSSTMTSPRISRPAWSRLVALTPARATPVRFRARRAPERRPARAAPPPPSGANVMPMMGRVTRPYLMICSTIPATMSLGSANPTPEDVPELL